VIPRSSSRSTNLAAGAEGLPAEEAGAAMPEKEAVARPRARPQLLRLPAEPVGLENPDGKPYPTRT
jgi:hypothetical protein